MFLVKRFLNNALILHSELSKDILFKTTKQKYRSIYFFKMLILIV